MRAFVLRTLAAATLALGVGTAQAQQGYAEDIDNTPSAAAMTADLLIVRPVSLVASVLGIGVFIVQLPIAAIQGEFEKPARKLVMEPLRFTFTRPLGSD